MKITYLADHQDVIPLLSKWFHREWAYLYPERTEDGVTRLISERTNRDKIPIALVAFDGKELIGTVCLKSNDMDTKPELNPWLAGLYVKESYRKNGVGSCLVKAIEQKAFEMGISRLFLYTPESEVFYSKLGWNIKEREDYRNVSVSVMEKENVL
jgi:N-acetylglutamate synthase-like GNAT family acetyltransferase